MDFELINMFEKAEEIQNLRLLRIDEERDFKYFKYKIGDTLFDIDRNVFWKINPLNNGWECGHKSNYRKSEILILSNDDFLRMSNLKWNEYYNDIIENYNNWNDPSKAGLVRYMKVNFNKIWDGEDWVCNC